MQPTHSESRNSSQNRCGDRPNRCWYLPATSALRWAYPVATCGPRQCHSEEQRRGLVWLNTRARGGPANSTRGHKSDQIQLQAWSGHPPGHFRLPQRLRSASGPTLGVLVPNFENQLTDAREARAAVHREKRSTKPWLWRLKGAEKAAARAERNRVKVSSEVDELVAKQLALADQACRVGRSQCRLRGGFGRSGGGPS